MGSTVEQALSHLDEQPGYAEKRGRHDDKTGATRSSGQKFGRNDGYSFPGEDCNGFRIYSSIEQSYWTQKLTTTEKLPIFDDEDNQELEHDVHSFVDKTTHLTTAVLRRGVEMSML